MNKTTDLDSKFAETIDSAEIKSETGNEGGNAFIVRKKKKYQYQAFLWLAPAIVLLLVFCYYPPVYSIIMSFTDTKTPVLGKWVGLDNYIKVLTDLYDVAGEKYMFWISMKNVIICIVVGLIGGNALTFIMAEILNDCASTRASSAYRFLFIVPMVVPGLVGMLIWQNIVFSAASNGLVNSFLGLFGIEPQGFYASEKQALWSIILTGFPWVGGTSLLIYLAGLQGINGEMVEAAKLDGITVVKRVFFIDLPCIAGQLKYFLVTGIIGGFQAYTWQLIFTHGGPGTHGATMVPGYLIYDTAFTDRQYGLSAAMGVILFLITLTLTIINMRMTNKVETEEQH